MHLRRADDVRDGCDLAGKSHVCEHVTVEQQFQHGLSPLAASRTNGHALVRQRLTKIPPVAEITG
jgi:hypothetical protein